MGNQISIKLCHVYNNIVYYAIILRLLYHNALISHNSGLKSQDENMPDIKLYV